MPRRRWLLLSLGLAALLLAPVLGNVAWLSCQAFLRGMCGLPKYRSGFAPDRLLGFALLALGTGLVAWAMGAGRRAAGPGGGIGRLLYGLRWAPVPLAVMSALLVALALAPGARTVLAASVVNVAEARPVTLTVREELEPTRESWYLHSLDHLFGLPAGGAGIARERSSSRNATFELRGAAASFQQWRQALAHLSVSTAEEGRGGHLALTLVPSESGGTEHEVKVAGTPECPHRNASLGRCHSQQLTCRRGAPELKIRVDFAGLD
jgi:hypothetical protein